MIKKIKLKNFKSFGNTEIDFTKANNKAKKLIAIYGENGSGKSNLISAFKFLFNTIRTLSMQEYVSDLILKKQINESEEGNIVDILSRARCYLGDEIKRCKTIDSIDNMELEYIFSANGKDAIYKMIFDDEKIIYESLQYPLEKNMTEVFVIDNGNIKFNQSLVNDKKFKDQLIDNIHGYFGKHTFLAILLNTFKKYNKSYLDEKMSKGIFEIFNEVFSCSILCKYLDGEEGLRAAKDSLLSELHEGELINNKENMDKIKMSQEALNQFFVALYSDIKSVEYHLTTNDNKVRYRLYFNKMIDHKIRPIPYGLESTGTTKLLYIFPLIYDCVNGKTVFVDEIDAGIHDLLMVELIDSLQDKIKGQLVFTTHNTLLLNHINPEAAYEISSDLNGNKTVNCFKDYGRIQGNHNVTDRYLKGIYGGIPTPGYLDLEEIVNQSKR